MKYTYYKKIICFLLLAFPSFESMADDNMTLSYLIKYWSMNTTISSNQYVGESFDTAALPGVAVALLGREYYGGVSLVTGKVHSRAGTIENNTNLLDVDVYGGYFVRPDTSMFLDLKLLRTGTTFSSNSGVSNGDASKQSLGLGGGVSYIKPVNRSLQVNGNAGLMYMSNSQDSSGSSTDYNSFNVGGELAASWSPKSFGGWHLRGGYKYRHNILNGSKSGTSIDEYGLFMGVAYSHDV